MDRSRGVVLILVGLAWLIGERFKPARLPGDIVIKHGSFRFYSPRSPGSLTVSVVLTVIFWSANPP